MADPRNGTLARALCDYSVGIKPGQVVSISARGADTLELATALVEEITRREAIPFLNFSEGSISSGFFHHATEDMIRDYALFTEANLQSVDAFITLEGERNSYEGSTIPPDRYQWLGKHYRERIVENIILRRNWVLVRYPNEAMAALAQMPTHTFRDFYYRVCCLDYRRLSEAMQPLKALMEQTDKVHIKGPGITDLRFSLAGMPAIPCDGKNNIPDGECFSAPVKDSVNGVIQFNTRTQYRSALFENVQLTCEAGRIVKATCNGNTAKLNEILDTDEGARSFGEWSLAFNPHITEPILDILFDEKIRGSFHLTPGAAYEDCDNGNRSAVHWDMVCIQRPEYGGGEIWFDGVLVRKDGLFVLDELKGLNPDRLESLL